MNANETKTCISDSPIIGNKEQDILGNDKYAEGLLAFLRSSDTPITIGIQGGWGSGKTSLINILQHRLEQNGDAINVFINAWEHSLFHSEDNKSNVAISLLSGVVESICAAIESKVVRPSSMVGSIGAAIGSVVAPPASPDGKRGLSEAVKAEALKEDSSLKKIGKFAAGLAAVTTRIGAKVYADLDVPSSEAGASPEAHATGAKLIRDLRNDLRHAVRTVIEKSSYKRFVCFIDDLDRIHPRIAIEILDVLKNVFDIPGCVFILAIDYDVVVKGLEYKFGKKDAENEREYRQYFDKIIQVPFSMPVGSYSKTMTEYIISQLNLLEIYPKDIKRLSEIANLATDGVPRAIKRIVNTMSLLIKIRESSGGGVLTADHVDLLFTVVALQINFPEIYKRLAEYRDYENWKPGELFVRWGLDKGAENCGYIDGDEIQWDDLNVDYGEIFDEEWEQVVFLLCQNSAWLRSKAVNVSRILSRLSEIKAEIPDEVFEETLNAVSVTSVENQSEIYEESSGPKDDRVTHFCRQVHEALIAKFGNGGIADLDPKNWSKKRGRTREYTVSYFYTDASIETWELTLNEQSGELRSTFYIKPKHGQTKQFREYFLKNLSAIGDVSSNRDDCYILTHPENVFIDELNSQDFEIAKNYCMNQIYSVVRQFSKLVNDFR